MDNLVTIFTALVATLGRYDEETMDIAINCYVQLARKLKEQNK